MLAGVSEMSTTRHKSRRGDEGANRRLLDLCAMFSTQIRVHTVNRGSEETLKVERRQHAGKGARHRLLDLTRTKSLKTSFTKGNEGKNLLEQ